MKNDSLQDREGVKIRRQFFNGMIFNILAVMLYGCYLVLTVKLLIGKFSIIDYFNEIKIFALVCVIAVIPFIVLSALNRRRFGEIICVINEHGLYYENGFLYWSDIDKIEYTTPVLGKHLHYDHCCVDIYTKSKKVELICAPLYLLFVAKRVGKNVKIKLSKESKWFVIILALIFLAFPFLAYSGVCHSRLEPIRF